MMVIMSAQTHKFSSSYKRIWQIYALLWIAITSMITNTLFLVECSRFERLSKRAIKPSRQAQMHNLQFAFMNTYDPYSFCYACLNQTVYTASQCIRTSKNWNTFNFIFFVLVLRLPMWAALSWTVLRNELTIAAPEQPGPGYSKLTTSLVNVSLKFR